jgi:molecular chaperone GrpE
VQRDLAEERRHAHAPFARELLPVLDNLQRALEAARQQGETGPLVQGVALVQSQLRDVFARFGITPIDALGQPFDPNLHEAVMQVPRDDVAPGTVVQVLEPGYRLHERVLRPARVAVAAPR